MPSTEIRKVKRVCFTDHRRPHNSKEQGISPRIRDSQIITVATRSAVHTLHFSSPRFPPPSARQDGGHGTHSPPRALTYSIYPILLLHSFIRLGCYILLVVQAFSKSPACFPSRAIARSRFSVPYRVVADHRVLIDS